MHGFYIFYIIYAYHLLDVQGDLVYSLFQTLGTLPYKIISKAHSNQIYTAYYSLNSKFLPCRNMNKQIVGKQLGISDAWWHEINELKNKVFVILERIEHIIGIV